MTDRTLAALDASPLFDRLSPRLRRSLVAAAATRRIAAGDRLLVTGELNESLFVVLQGAVDVVLPGIDAPHVRLGPGECVGELSILDGQPVSADVVAAEPTELLQLDQIQVWSLIDASATFARNLLRILARRVRNDHAVLAEASDERRRFERLSMVDGLTTLHNRRWFDEMFPLQVLRLGREGRIGALLMADADRFKEINDRHGHALGDAALVAVAGRLRESLRESDTIVRWGGEEFLVVARTTPDRLDDIAARILRAVAGEPIVVGDRAIRTSVSIGYVPLPLPPTTAALSWDRAIGLVDMALYLAKMNGRNRAYGIQRLADADPETLAATERDLEHAWKSGRVEVSVLFGPPPLADAVAGAASRAAANDTRVA